MDKQPINSKGFIEMRQKTQVASIAPITCSEELKNRLAAYGKDSHVPQAAIIRVAIEEYLDKMAPSPIQ
jgi:predicted DNA-binding protein